MLEWLGKHLGTIIVLGLVSAGVLSVIIGMIKSKRSGKSACSCGCSSCAMSASCHGAKDASDNER